MRKKRASPILNSLYTPFDSPVPGGQKPQKGRANQQRIAQCIALLNDKGEMTNDKDAHALRANKIFKQSSQRAYDNYTLKNSLEERRHPLISR